MKKWLDHCVGEEIFEEVPEGEAVTCCSPLLIQPKPKFNAVDEEKLEAHMIRASVSLRVPNQFMERNRITQGPIVEDFMYNFILVLFSPDLASSRGSTKSYSIQSPEKLPLLAPRGRTFD